MQELDALTLTRHAIIISLELTLPILIVSLIIGVMVSLFQAATQIQEQTLSFVPKVLIMSVALVVLGPWMLHTIVGFTSGLFRSLATTLH